MNQVFTIKFGAALLILLGTAAASSFITYSFVRQTQGVVCVSQEEVNAAKADHERFVKVETIPDNDGRKF